MVRLNGKRAINILHQVLKQPCIQMCCVWFFCPSVTVQNVRKYTTVFIFISDLFADDSGGTFPYRRQPFTYCTLGSKISCLCF